MEQPGQDDDAIVAGAGPVAQNAADRARAAGLSVAVVERELVGGECSYWACGAVLPDDQRIVAETSGGLPGFVSGR